MSGVFLGLGARLAGTAIFKSAAGIFTAIPRPVWEGLAVLGYLLAGYATHQRAAHQHDTAIIAAEDARINKLALAQKARIDALTTELTTKDRTQNDEKNSRIAATATTVLVRGPGKAVCPSVAVAASPPVRHDQAAPQASASVAPVPDSGGEQLIALPFAPTVELVKEHDQCLVDLQSVIDQHEQLLKVWPKGAH